MCIRDSSVAARFRNRIPAVASNAQPCGQERARRNSLVMYERMLGGKCHSRDGTPGFAELADTACAQRRADSVAGCGTKRRIQWGRESGVVDPSALKSVSIDAGHRAMRPVVVLREVSACTECELTHRLPVARVEKRKRRRQVEIVEHWAGRTSRILREESERSVEDSA